MRRRSLEAAFALLATGCLAAPLSGCSSYLLRARQAYTEGRYFESFEELAAHEDELHTLAPAPRAQYAATRGRALLSLGERGEAVRWLRFATDVAKAHPGALPASEATELTRLVQELGGSAAQETPRAPSL